jgi:photosystem II oxygen-evolving enhancer protein 3
MARIVLALAAGAAALAPGAKPAAQTRRELGSGLMAAVGALGAQAAVATSGDSPKFSFFGFFGNGGTQSEGAMYGSDQSGSPVYSPYSVYGKLGADDQIYKKYNAKEIEFKKKMLVTSEGRVKKVIDFIEKKQWENVRTDLDSQVYNMRATMNYLAAAPGANPGAKAAAKQFYQDMEDVNLLCKRKKQAAAQDAYGAMMASLAAYNKQVGI